VGTALTRHFPSLLLLRSSLNRRKAEMDSKVVEKSSKGKKMNSLRIVYNFAGWWRQQQPNGEPFKAYAPRMSREFQTTERRVKAFIYQEAKRIDGDEVMHIQELRDRYVAKFESAAARLEAVDPEFHRERIALYREQIRQLRNLAD